MSSKQPSKQFNNIITESDYQELQKAYTFIISHPEHQKKTNENSSNDIIASTTKAAQLTSNSTESNPTTQSETTTWQDRMVIKYHSHLYKSHVIADLTNYKMKQIGLRWRTKQEVISGKGFDTCGNKYCPCYFHGFDDGDDCQETMKKKKSMQDVIRWKKNSQNQYHLYTYMNDMRDCTTHHLQHQRKLHNNDDDNAMLVQEENERLKKIPHGIGLYDYTVHFGYKEYNTKKEELVKLKLCFKCAPNLFYDKGHDGVLGALIARSDQTEQNACDNNNDDSNSSFSSPSSTSSFQSYTKSENKRKSKGKDRKYLKEKDTRHKNKRKRKHNHSKTYKTSSSSLSSSLSNVKEIGEQVKNEQGEINADGINAEKILFGQCMDSDDNT
mmetsp:Transcript_14574/g.17731  ORF Transcript_14574/g.17731 Transcript_14574/m.17731 type:complete len:384 (+) Transcript_14574:69-1220(+)